MPEKLGRFEIRERLGAGAFGAVYRARDPLLDREVALKVPHPSTLQSPTQRVRVLTEAKAAAQLRHPNIVPVYEAGHDGETYYIAAAFIAGQTLEDAMDGQKPDFRRAAKLVLELARALDYAHQSGVVHRDVKPANIMLDAQGNPLLMDFGLARLDAAESKLTHDGTVLGTPVYMPPEQASGQLDQIGPASDQYSLGVVLYELLCGETPFSGPPAMVISMVLNQEPDSPRTVNAAIPKDLETICLKAMAKKCEHRYASCRELAADLRRWLSGEPITARRVNPVERFARWCSRNPVVAGSTAAAAALLVLVAVVSMWANTKASQAFATANQEHQRAEAERQRAEQSLEKEAGQRKRAEQLEKIAAEKQALEKMPQEKGTLEKNAPEKSAVEEKQPAASSAPVPPEPTIEDTLIRFNANLTGLPLSKASPNERKLIRKLDEPTEIECVQIPLVDVAEFLSAKHNIQIRLDRKPLEAAGISADTAITCNVSGVSLRIGLRQALRDHEIAAIIEDEALLLTTKSRALGLKRGGALVPEPSRPEAAAAPSETAGSGMLPVKGSAGQLKRAAFNPTGKTMQQNSHMGVVSSVAFSPDGRRLAADGNETVRIFDPTTGDEVMVLKGHTLAVNSLAFSPDGKRLVSASSDNIRIWDTTTGKVTMTLRRGTIVAFSPDGKHVASAGGLASPIDLWDITSRKKRIMQKGRSFAASSLAFSPDGQHLAVGGYDKTIKILDTTTGKETLAITNQAEAVLSVAFSPDGKKLACDTRDGAIMLSDVATGRQPLTLAGHSDTVYSVAFSPDGKWLASGSEDKTIRLWDPATGQEFWSITQSSAAASVAFAPDGKKIAVGGANGSVTVWDLRPRPAWVPAPAPVPTQ
ncbi:MAG TPA: protein kinase [Pirellulales bacterium]|nr:protein kinase [Pirellulales bacterium]